MTTVHSELRYDGCSQQLQQSQISPAYLTVTISSTEVKKTLKSVHDRNVSSAATSRAHPKVLEECVSKMSKKYVGASSSLRWWRFQFYWAATASICEEAKDLQIFTRLLMYDSPEFRSHFCRQKGSEDG